MTTSKTVVIALGIAVAWGMTSLQAGEHPKEHPTAPAAAPKSAPKKAQEHPTASGEKAEHPSPAAKKEEHPKEHPTAEEETKRKALKKEFSAAVEAYVGEESRKTDGFFVVRDDKLSKDWKLKLVRIHKKNIAQLAEDRFFACADFSEGSNWLARFFATTVDLDFYVRKTSSGWKVEDVLVHKVDGKPRFTYDKNNNRVPVKG